MLLTILVSKKVNRCEKGYKEKMYWLMKMFVYTNYPQDKI